MGPRRCCQRLGRRSRTWTSSVSMPNPVSLAAHDRGHFLGDDDDDFRLAVVDAYNNFLFDEFSAPDRDRSSARADPVLGVEGSAVDYVRSLKAKSSRRRHQQRNWPEGRGESCRGRRPVPLAAAPTMALPVCIHIQRYLAQRPPEQRKAADTAKLMPGWPSILRRLRGPTPTLRGRRPAGVFATVRRLWANSSSPACSSGSPICNQPSSRTVWLDPALSRVGRRPLLRQPLVGAHPAESPPSYYWSET